MAQASEATRLGVVRDASGNAPEAKVLQAVQQAVAGEYDVLGELGRGPSETIVYIARQLRGGGLVALRVRPGLGAAAASRELWLDVLRQLDDTTSGPPEACTNCGQVVGGLDRYCDHCGTDLAGASPAPGDSASAGQLLRAVTEAAGARYEVLGQMDRAEGGGIVYFARERATAKLVALRLRRDAVGSGGTPQFSLGRTTILKSVAESMGVVYGAPAPRPAPPPSAAPPVAAPFPPPPPVPVAAAPAPAPPVSMPTVPVAGAAEILQRYGLPIAAVATLAVLIAVSAVRPRPSGLPTPGPDTLFAQSTSGQLASSDSAQITIGGSLPRGTTLSIDGRAVTGPTIAAAPGAHTLRATAPGYLAATQSLELAAGQHMTWTPQVVPRPVGQSRPPRPPSPLRPAPPSSEDVKPPPAARAPEGPQASARPPGAVVRSPNVDSTLASRPTTTGNATCASLFSALEWDRALSICQREAADGNVSSERTLGTLYERGLGTAPNPKQAAVWYRRAADAGDRVAQYGLGVLERDGSGVHHDAKGAVELFRKSAEQGYPDAQSAMGTAYERGDGVKRDYAQAVDWYHRAADQGHPGATYRLGVLYAQGKGVAKSEADAITWWKKAAAEGEPAARKELSRRGLTP